MTPVNVKLDDLDIEKLDSAIASGFATNRSSVIRLALQRQFEEWERAAWDDGWAKVAAAAQSPAPDEFSDMNKQATAAWDQL
jgi:Arc/MetJ-type ribon-helix-helix transcriptional regulator